MICATARTGSTYLCQLLGSTGLLGHPREYFNTDGSRRRYDPAYPNRSLGAARHHPDQGGHRNGIYAVKVIAPQLTPLERHRRSFPRPAESGLGQGPPQGSAGPGHIAGACAADRSIHRLRSAKGGTTYDVQAIRHGLQSIRACRRRSGRGRCRGWTCSPLSIAYEDFLADPQAVVDRIALHHRTCPAGCRSTATSSPSACSAMDRAPSGEHGSWPTPATSSVTSPTARAPVRPPWSPGSASAS